MIIRALTKTALAAVLSGLLVLNSSAQQHTYKIATEKGRTLEVTTPHPLSWWTQNTLRLDTSGDLMLGSDAPDGRRITYRDFRIKQRIVSIGRLAGHRIIQITTVIRSGLLLTSANLPSVAEKPTVWKDLLISTNDGKHFIELYALRYDGPRLMHVTTAAIYGKGNHAMLATDDPDTGNGGGCFDGYWWVDRDGAHNVNFSLLTKGMLRAIPPKTTYTSDCRALKPKRFQLQSPVQSTDTQCHACGILGEVQAFFRMEHGAAIPISVIFRPSTP